MEKLATPTSSRLGAFVAERHPLALAEALDAFVAVDGDRVFTPTLLVERESVGPPPTAKRKR